MKIVVLDGYTLNPGDLNWDDLKNLGDCAIYDRTKAEDTISRIGDAEIIFTNKVIIDKDVLDACSKLKYIGVLATGYNVVDLELARQLGIVVTNIPAYSTDSVAQMVFAHILNITHRVSFHAEQVSQGEWSKSIDFSYWSTTQMELAGKTIGIIGFGKIGQRVAELAKAFGMKIIFQNRSVKKDLPDGYKQVDIDVLLKGADIVSINCPLTNENKEFINRSSLSIMKPTAILINSGRGPLINEQDLADALNSGKIAAAGLDVLSQEPPKPDNPLITAKNCYITPHIAWATLEARQRLMNIAVSNLKAFMNGKPINVVN
ncbi:D-2-hydroxyacid dehydrogenase [Sunxiuqinia sp. A32]|uniref:D-2-hydroxyacid dehydrogenase n=1 Tax=Sunxiuqinia sp. A32 TaxID=3461496 RepID=UPI0040466222